MPQLLVIDDEEAICWGLAELGKRLGLEVETAATAEQGLELATRRLPDLVLLDVRLPGIDGLTALAKLRELAPTTPVVIMTAHGDLATAVEAVRQGASDYVAKPFDLAQIERLIARALDDHQLPAAKPATVQPDDGLVGRTAAMQEVFKRIALVAPSQACVLLAGESGTGKELVARAIHRYSRRLSGPFVAVNVAALNPQLAESELFGHVRGAFTGADQPRQGLLVEASGGTLFLDEVADIPPPIQVKLLRALEHGEVLPVGSGKPVPTSFRLVSATHRNLAEEVRQGKFRLDLYYRLATFLVDLPPLRARQDDIPPLVDYFVQKFTEKYSTGRVSQVALDEIASREWHGNVRELRNAVEHALIMARDGVILPEHLPQPMAPLAVMPSDSRSSAAPVPAASVDSDEQQLRDLVAKWAAQRVRTTDASAGLYNDFLALVEPPFLEAAIRRHHGQCASAARVLGIHRTTLKKKLDQYGIAGEE
jgi:two-component system nitrogen regulation response regulator GlnG